MSGTRASFSSAMRLSAVQGIVIVGRGAAAANLAAPRAPLRRANARRAPVGARRVPLASSPYGLLCFLCLCLVVAVVLLLSVVLVPDVSLLVLLLALPVSVPVSVPVAVPVLLFSYE